MSAGLDDRTTEAAAPAAPLAAPRHQRVRSLRQRRQRASLALTVPTWVLLVALFAVPLAVGVYLSFRNSSLAFLTAERFVGLQNYRSEVLSGAFLDALQVTLVIIALDLAVQIPVGLGLALLLHRELRGSRFFRSSLLLPMLLTPVAVGLMWRFMLNTDLGIVNWLLTSVGLPDVDWLGGARAAIFAVVLVDSWQAIPFVMLLSLAGLAGLPREPMEAAAVDGATARQAFRYVTLPLLKPVLLIILMIRLIDGLKLFDTIYILTFGGPGTATQTLSLLAYKTGFRFLATSRAAALGVVLALLTLPVWWLWQRATRTAGR